MTTLRRIFCGLALTVVVVLGQRASEAAILAPGSTLYNTAIAGGTTTYAVALQKTAYTAGLPSYVTDANLVAMTVPAYAFVESGSNPGLAGDLTSWVYTNDKGGLTFVYQFTGAKSSDPVKHYLDSATLGTGTLPGGADWQGVTIYNAGANSDGVSTAAGKGVSWADGDPYLLTRENSPANESVRINWWKSLPTTAGTRIDGSRGQYSSAVWFETDAQYWAVGEASLFNGSATSVSQYLGPILVPEPASAIAWAGLLLFGAVVIRRRRS